MLHSDNFRDAIPNQPLPSYRITKSLPSDSDSLLYTPLPLRLSSWCFALDTHESKNWAVTGCMDGVVECWDYDNFADVRSVVRFRDGKALPARVTTGIPASSRRNRGKGLHNDEASASDLSSDEGEGQDLTLGGADADLLDEANETAAIQDAHFLAQDKGVMTCDSRGDIVFYDLNKQSQRFRIRDSHKGASVHKITELVDGQVYASGDEFGVVKIWDVRVRRDIATIDEHGDEVTSMIYNQDAAALYVSSADGSVSHIELSKREPSDSDEADKKRSKKRTPKRKLSKREKKVIERIQRREAMAAAAEAEQKAAKRASAKKPQKELEPTKKPKSSFPLIPSDYTAKLFDISKPSSKKNYTEVLDMLSGEVIICSTTDGMLDVYNYGMLFHSAVGLRLEGHSVDHMLFLKENIFCSINSVGTLNAFTISRKKQQFECSLAQHLGEHDDYVTACALDSEGKFIITAGGDQYLKFFDSRPVFGLEAPREEEEEDEQQQDKEAPEEQSETLHQDPGTETRSEMSSRKRANYLDPVQAPKKKKRRKMASKHRDFFSDL